MKKNVQTTAEYIAAVESSKKVCFHSIYRLITDTVPEAILSLKYDMLYFSVEENWIALADQKHHVSLYINRRVMEQHSTKLGDLNCGKSCIRLHPKKEVPVNLLRILIRESLSH